MAKTAQQMVIEANAVIPAITPRDAQHRLATGDAVLLDVREPTEWETYIAGAVQIPRGILEAKADPTTRPWTPASRSSSTAAPAHEQRSPASPSSSSATPTS
jgi:rhodanese-related sulfurtransferase